MKLFVFYTYYRVFFSVGTTGLAQLPTRSAMLFFYLSFIKATTILHERTAKIDTWISRDKWYKRAQDRSRLLFLNPPRPFSAAPQFVYTWHRFPQRIVKDFKIKFLNSKRFSTPCGALQAVFCQFKGEGV